jgi:hypothetical protein
VTVAELIKLTFTKPRELSLTLEWCRGGRGGSVTRSLGRRRGGRGK